jgi:hypothetical protein
MASRACHLELGMPSISRTNPAANWVVRQSGRRVISARSRFTAEPAPTIGSLEPV